MAIAPPENNHSKTRILTTCALIPIVLFLYMGGLFAAGVIVIIGAIMVHEVLTITAIEARKIRGMVIATAVIFPAMYGAIYGINDGFMLASLVIVLVLGRSVSGRVMLVCLTVCLYSVIGILMMPAGTVWLLFIIAVVTMADSGAYFGGRHFGGVKLLPSISPSKTWSGAGCGVIGAVVIAMLIAPLLGIEFALGVELMLVGAGLAIVSILGDLLESWFKRKHGVKDSGRILPGHGGFLDRFDGYLLVMPVAYAALRFFSMGG